MSNSDANTTTDPSQLPNTESLPWVDAAILAGGINRIPLFPGNKPGKKALVELAGRPMLAYVMDALAASRYINRIFIVGPDEVCQFARNWPGVKRVEGLPEGETVVDNAWRALRMAQSDRVLFCNPDQPLLRTEMIDAFLEPALEQEADVVSSWARSESLEKLGHYPEGEHKFAPFGDGRYGHGNLFLVRRQFPHAVDLHQRMIRLYEARKNNFRFVWELGPAFLARFVVANVLGQMPSLEETLRMTSEHFQVSIGSVVLPDPELVLDIDEPQDYVAAERYLLHGPTPLPTDAGKAQAEPAPALQS